MRILTKNMFLIDFDKRRVGPYKGESFDVEVDANFLPTSDLGKAEYFFSVVCNGCISDSLELVEYFGDLLSKRNEFTIMVGPIHITEILANLLIDIYSNTRVVPPSTTMISTVEGLFYGKDFAHIKTDENEFSFGIKYLVRAVIFESELISNISDNYLTYRPKCNMVWLTESEPNLPKTFLDKATILDFRPYWDCSSEVVTECGKFIGDVAKERRDEIFTLIINTKIKNHIWSEDDIIEIEI